MKNSFLPKLAGKGILLGLIACVGSMRMASAQVTVIDVQDSIYTDTHWTCDNQYLLHGYVYVINGTTLTIDPGTIIKGDKDSKGALIVERGAKIIAAGTEEKPIIFTSNQPAGQRSYGDWGGVILCGYAPCNWLSGEAQVEGGPRSLYGGNDPNDNSGTLTYVRIEFAGIAFSPNNEVNGLSLCAVGDATTINHIQISYSGDDGIEFFGGRANLKYLVMYRTWDDDFDTDNGYQGHLQYGVALRDPYAADVSGSKSFESDSYQSGTASGIGDTSMLTKPVFENFTLVGPLVSPTSTAYDPQFTAGVHLRRGSSTSLINSLVIGYPCGILIDESSASYGSTAANIRNNDLWVRSTVVCGIPTTNTPNKKEVEYVIDGARSLTPTNVEGDTITGSPFAPWTGPFNWFLDPSFNNKIYPTEQSGILLQSPFNLDNPNFVPTSVSPLVYNSHILPGYVTMGGTIDPFMNGKHYPYDPTQPINTDTSAFFTHYNAPDLVPLTSGWKINDPFFTVENHIGAFGRTGTTDDNWTAGWCDWDPVNTDYSGTCFTSGIHQPVEGSFDALFFPNPSNGITILQIDMANSTQADVSIYSIDGRLVFQQNAIQLVPGLNYIQLNLDIPAGIYAGTVHTSYGNKTVKLVINK